MPCPVQGLTEPPCFRVIVHTGDISLSEILHVAMQWPHYGVTLRVTTYAMSSSGRLELPGSPLPTRSGRRNRSEMTVLRPLVSQLQFRPVARMHRITRLKLVDVSVCFSSGYSCSMRHRR